MLKSLVHDPKHRGSCFKKDCVNCRYHFPGLVQQDKTGVGWHEKSVLLVSYRRREPFLYVATTCAELSRIYHSNTCVKVVGNFNLAYYLSNYVTKSNKEDEGSYAAALNAVIRNMKRNGCDGSVQSVGVGQLISAARGHTGGEVVHAMMAAHLLNGYERFVASHEFIFQSSHSFFKR